MRGVGAGGMHPQFVQKIEQCLQGKTQRPQPLNHNTNFPRVRGGRYRQCYQKFEHPTWDLDLIENQTLGQKTVRVFRNMYKGHTDKTKGRQDQGWEVGMAGVGEEWWWRKWRQLYLNNNTKIEKLNTFLKKEKKKKKTRDGSRKK